MCKYNVSMCQYVLVCVSVCRYTCVGTCQCVSVCVIICQQVSAISMCQYMSLFVSYTVCVIMCQYVSASFASPDSAAVSIPALGMHPH